MATYEIMGYGVPEGDDVNTDPNAGLANKPPLVPFYTTDDLAEVERILEAGGYTDSSNVYWVAEGYREADVLPEGATIRKSAAGVPPENSTAEVLPDGTVRTDRQKEPVTQDDVVKMAESEVNVEHPRKIVDHDGRL